jgi:hypothetical protein
MFASSQFENGRWILILLKGKRHVPDASQRFYAVRKIAGAVNCRR